MDAPVRDPQQESIGELVSRLIDEAREVARTEVDLYRQIALRRSAKAKSGLVQLVAAGVLAWFAGLALTFGAVLALATLIGPLAAGLGLALAMAGLAYMLLRKGLAGMKALSGDEEERAAIERGENRP
ncbi:MAG TPA: phage holin family protein [Allosphingosinicella sp.]